ncbi:MAG: glycosyltransferase family 1 protein [Candidatus Shapirobacteria bacterium]
MIIGVDGNEANSKNRVGVGQFAFHLLSELNRQNQSDTYYIYLKDQPQNDLPPESKHWHYLVIGPKKLWTKIALPLSLFFFPKKLNLFYTPSHYSPLYSIVPTVPTIHDIGYLKYRDQFTKKDLYQLVNWTESSLKKAKHVIAVSQFTKNELINTYQIPSEKISVIYNGVGRPTKISSTVSRDVLKKFKITKPYFLAIGTLKPNKNYPFLIEAFSQFLIKNPNFQLVIAGKKGWLFDEIDTVIKKLKISDHVIFTDYISETEKWTLYQNSVSLVIPSTYEGFGIPAIESQKVGTPVIASNIPSLREVLDDSAIYINPEKINSLVTAMEKIIDKNFRQNLSQNSKKQADKFTWENSAKELILLFHQKFGDKNV